MNGTIGINGERSKICEKERLIQSFLEVFEGVLNATAIVEDIGSEYDERGCAEESDMFYNIYICLCLILDHMAKIAERKAAEEEFE